MSKQIIWVADKQSDNVSKFKREAKPRTILKLQKLPPLKISNKPQNFEHESSVTLKETTNENSDKENQSSNDSSCIKYYTSTRTLLGEQQTSKPSKLSDEASTDIQFSNNSAFNNDGKNRLPANKRLALFRDRLRVAQNSNESTSQKSQVLQEFLPTSHQINELSAPLINVSLNVSRTAALSQETKESANESSSLDKGKWSLHKLPSRGLEPLQVTNLNEELLLLNNNDNQNYSNKENIATEISIQSPKVSFRKSNILTESNLGNVRDTQSLNDSDIKVQNISKSGSKPGRFSLLLQRLKELGTTPTKENKTCKSMPTTPFRTILHSSSNDSPIQNKSLNI